MKKLFALIIAISSILSFTAQDNCASAVSIDLDVIYTIDEVNGTQAPDVICASGGSNNDAGEWYQYTKVV